MNTQGTFLIPTILCGGVGSRLWPVSRKQHPKPFIRMGDGESLLQKSFLRGTSLANVSHLITVTNREQYFKIEDEYQEISHLIDRQIDRTFILEPVGRNTAPAIATACILASENYGNDAIMLVLTADHLISDQEAFADAVADACKLALDGRLVAFGVRPTAPETGYGYIESDGHNVLRFVEKPSLEKAREYVASGNFLWNSGMLCFTVGSMLQEMAKYCPGILEATKASMQHSRSAFSDGFSQVELSFDHFKQVADNSIDYAIMEKTRNAAVVACDIGWSDIGCWRSLGDLEKFDDNNNRIQGDAVVIDSSNCTINSEGRLVGVVGVDGLVIVDTPDALLVADKSRVQDVKNIYAQLESQGHEAHELHRTVHRPWGTYTVLEEGENFKIKHIEVKIGSSLSLQMHHHRSEHWVVVSGTAKVLNDDRELILNINESTFIPAGHKHRLENIGPEQLVIIEVQTGDYLGEEDIIRFDDAFGRVPHAS